MRGANKSKASYKKIRFCAEQAAKDGLQYFWVDTCCIDKKNNTELSKAINSMFRWYQSAAKCYVYLPDVSIHDARINDQPFEQIWQPAFQKSRWFTRGWTLQELLAPKNVEFFASEGQRLGDKKGLAEEIHQITEIAVNALHGSPLSEFSVEARMSWAKERRTKEEEDAAYSLLGIFDVSMPLIYGEGREKAMKRLWEEIDKTETYQCPFEHRQGTASKHSLKSCR
ncbi:HET-domain-containing protein [Zopfia rhizophila CBS 207.26]|uniref:HET-domain-containing protein n=1 Tax=Zopfia rhizophila CBS 207.26 TaxID=1314779 RepID=A0A6A6DZ03_9PEZI|nr:HET-domain-containing protein [Zopfia rhizophila CBS 207.26]